jgi:hypothetical protein
VLVEERVVAEAVRGSNHSEQQQPHRPHFRSQPVRDRRPRCTAVPHIARCPSCPSLCPHSLCQCCSVEPSNSTAAAEPRQSHGHRPSRWREFKRKPPAGVVCVRGSTVIHGVQGACSRNRRGAGEVGPLLREGGVGHRGRVSGGRQRHAGGCAQRWLHRSPPRVVSTTVRLSLSLLVRRAIACRVGASAARLGNGMGRSNHQRGVRQAVQRCEVRCAPSRPHAPYLPVLLSYSPRVCSTELSLCGRWLL